MQPPPVIIIIEMLSPLSQTASFRLFTREYAVYGLILRLRTRISLSMSMK